ncbi:MAG TPA: TolC family protein [Thermoanaerobaculia bacterium]|nr:TolC family protein [Thermoanaerobaculia bacterium]
MKSLLLPILIGSLICPTAAVAQETPAVVIDPAAAAADGLTLREAVLIALAENPSAARARSEVDLAASQVRGTRAAILPQVYLNGRYTRNDREVAFDFDGTEVSILPADDWSTSVTLSQPVYAGGRELKAIRQARLNVERSSEAATQTESDVLFDLAASYLNVLSAETLVGVEEQNVQVATRQRRQAEDFYSVGEVTRIDVLRAESSIKSAERQLAAATQAREAAASLLRLSLGVDVPVRLERPELDLPPLPAESELIAMAQARRPETRRAGIALEIADLEVRKQRGAYLPLVTAQATYTQQASTFPSDHYGAVTLNFSVPVFTSGEIGSRVATAAEQEKQAHLALEQVRQVVTEDVRRALVALETARTAIALATDQRHAAEAEYEQIFELYRAQEATSLDVHSAESALAEARRAVVQTTLDRDLAELQVWYAAGALKPVLLNE